MKELPSHLMLGEMGLLLTALLEYFNFFVESVDVAQLKHLLYLNIWYVIKHNFTMHIGKYVNFSPKSVHWFHELLEKDLAKMKYQYTRF